nr:MAG TPA: hypothetical protein [Caudoviricetes sp.]DAF11308.1 MAG TPA: hypothetical protein [Caudoviricetes sp.]
MQEKCYFNKIYTPFATFLKIISLWQRKTIKAIGYDKDFKGY